MTELKRWYQEHGVCSCCGQRAAIRGQKLCPDCRDYYNERNNKYHYEHRSELLPKMRERGQKRYEKRKNEGICVSCGKRPAKQGKVRCAYCLIKDAKRHEVIARENDVLPRELMGKGEYCATCGKPVNGTKLCEKCYANAVRGLEIARQQGKRGWQTNDYLFVKKVRYG